MDIFAVSLLVLVFIGSIFIYNRLVRDKNRVLSAWSDIDVQLKRRHDLLPKLVEAVKQYAKYEQATLRMIVELRSRADAASAVAERCDIEGELGQGIKKLIALAEAYPDLKASQNFLDLQHNITEVEEHIQFARRYYNGSVRNLNTRIDSFPDLLIAKVLGYRHADYFTMEK